MASATLSCVSRPILPRATPSRLHAAVAVRRRFERPDDRRSNGDDPPAARLRATDGRRSALGNVKELVQWETRVQRRASGRGESGGVSEGGEADCAPPPDLERSPF